MVYRVTLLSSDFAPVAGSGGNVAGDESTGAFSWDLQIDGQSQARLSIALVGAASESAARLTARAQTQLTAALRGWAAALVPHGH